MSVATFTRGASAVLAVAALAASCSKGGEPVNALLITVDCLRADRVGASGYPRDTTPSIDALAAEGLRFERAYSQAPFTAPSHASLLTSLDTQSHGVVFWGRKLAPSAITFGDLFSDAGYETGAFHNHPSLVANGITRGFEHVSVQPFGPWSVTVADFEAWLDAHAGRPFAAWVHLWDAHRPYGFRNYDSPESGSLATRGVPARYPYAEKFFGPEHDVRVGRHEGFYNLERSEREAPIEVGGKPRQLDESDYQYIADRYDNAVRVADRGVGGLVQVLRKRGLLEDTVVVVTADHGESLREQAGCWFTHDPYLTEETLHVPLVVRWPGARERGTVRRDLANGIDVLPTLLEACGIAAPASLQGRSLVRPPPPGEERLSFAATRGLSAKESARRAPEGGWVEQREAVTDGAYRLVHDLDLDRFSFHDLVRDPGEKSDLLVDGEWPQRARELLAAWSERRAQWPRADPTQDSTSDAERELLERLGYLDPQSR